MAVGVFLIGCDGHTSVDVSTDVSSYTTRLDFGDVLMSPDSVTYELDGMPVQVVGKVHRLPSGDAQLVLTAHDKVVEKETYREVGERCLLVEVNGERCEPAVPIFDFAVVGDAKPVEWEGKLVHDGSAIGAKATILVRSIRRGVGGSSVEAMESTVTIQMENCEPGTGSMPISFVWEKGRGIVRRVTGSTTRESKF